MNICKRLMLVLLVLACAGGLFAQKSITLVSPSSEVNLQSGKTAHIHWTYTGFPDSALVTVLLFQNGVKKGQIAADIPIHANKYTAGNGGYLWTVGKYNAGTAPAGCGYAIKVWVQGPSEANAMSAKAFCIVGGGQGTFQLTAPSGGEKIILGNLLEIRWAASGLVGNVKIALRKAGWVMDRAIANSVPLADGKFSWKTGDLLDPHPDLTEPVSGLKVFVQTLGGDFSDESDGTFSLVKAIIPDISSPPVDKWIQLQKPAAGATFTRIGACDIAWTFSASLKRKRARLLLLRPNGDTQMVIEPSLPLNIDDYHWNIPGVNFLPEGDYRLRLQSLDFARVYGDSGVFHVKPHVHDLEMTYTFTPAITNKGRYHMHRDSKDVFIIAPEGLEFADPGASCCRLGWTNECHDEWNVNWIYRSHLALDVSKIKAPASVLEARLTWSDNGANPTPVFLYKLTGPWDGEPMSLFSVPCEAVNPNDSEQLRAAVEEWVKQPGKNYGLVFTGSDESMNCSHAKTSIHVLCNLKLEVKARVTVVD